MGIFFGKMFRAILMLLDDAVYGLAEMVYRLFIRLSETGIFSPESIQTFAGRIYFFLGLAMLFKVSISIIDYIMNPDSIKDNKIGASKLIKNIVTILIGIVAIPYVFEAAYSLQRIILQENVIGNLILGQSFNSSDDAKTFVGEAGDRMSFTTYTAFFHLTDKNEAFSASCIASPVVNGTISADCKNSKGFDELNKISVEDFEAAYNNQNMHLLTKFEFMNATIKDNSGADEYFLFDYMYAVSTLAGAFLCYILLVFCFDIAVRSVKLGFLQLIAPIPLISKIDPKKGDEIFSKWVKECVSTYGTLFARLVAIYFAIYIISSLTDTYNIVTGKDEKNLFVNVFIIFGVLLFVKDLPKLIKNLTGIDISGGTLSLNKKLRDVPVLGKPTAEGIALGGRTIGNAGRGLLKGLKSKDMKGSMGAAWDDIKNDARNYGHGMWTAGKQTLGVNDRQLDRLEAAKARIMKQNQTQNKKINTAKARADKIKAMEDRAWDQISTGVADVNDSDGRNLSDRFRELNAALDVAKTGQNAAKIAEAQKALDDFKLNSIKDYMANVDLDKDKTFGGMYHDYEQLTALDNDTGIALGSRSELHTTFGKLKGAANDANRELMESNQLLSEIEEQQKQIQEDVKSSKPYYTAKR